MSKSKSKIIHYCNSPTRYLHGLVTEVDHQNLPLLYRLVLPFFKWWLRLLDLDAVNNLNKKGAIWIGNSKFCSQMIKEVYKVNSQTIYPPIDLDYFFGLKRLYKFKQRSKSTQQNMDPNLNSQINTSEQKIGLKYILEKSEISQEFGLEKSENQTETDKNQKKQTEKEQKLEVGSQNSLQSKLENSLETSSKSTSKTVITNNLQNQKNLNLKNFRADLETLELNKKLQNEDYYYYFGRISFHKRIDLAILSCLTLGKKLKICGASAFAAEMDKLKKLVIDFEAQNPDKIGLVEFLGRLENEKRDLYLQYCRAFIFPAKEDFGIAPVEVLASGTPIIAYKAGGALEYVIEKRENSAELESLKSDLDEKNNFNGVFFEEQTVESLCEAIVEFEKIETWDTDFIRQSVAKFDQKYFRENMEKLVNN